LQNGSAPHNHYGAELLVNERFHEDAVSRAYYAILHAAKAALFVHNVAATSHAAVRRLFGQHLINTGEIERQWSSHLGESFDDRLAADYDARTVFSSFRIDYLKPSGAIGFYHPDWVVVQ
jgi:uncharacterized protein (UPF0332 family)